MDCPGGELSLLSSYEEGFPPLGAMSLALPQRSRSQTSGPTCMHDKRTFTFQRGSELCNSKFSQQ